ncbi:tetratricopeptide repeat protein [Scleromatobacter humisilvae]|uniref:Tetratricopeptide repeat protein n=1 Tax=Scleromatobacter humisilvae TaxID=2897159 RepID=A0A9X1YMW6_9BURK|nr:tetratricopeptide repeat protein [Scleromatobacter humisilvae]MCK9688722.1 tetratricopeptide repeat protein [Scleromatobacter humisilvae]
MRTRRTSAWGAWLLAAVLAASGPSGAADLQAGQPDPADDRVPLGDTGMSAEELKDFNGQSLDEKRRRLDVILAGHPTAIGARFLRLQADDQLADFPAMLADSEPLLADSTFDRRLREIALVIRAGALIQVRRPAEAIVAASEALDIDPTDSDALFDRGWARYHADHGQVAAALADLDRALQLDPTQGIGYFRRATIYQEQRQYDRAEKDFDRALQFAPDDVPTHLQYGQMLIEVHEFERARAQFDAVVRLAPDYSAGWNWRAGAEVSLGQLDQAFADANRAIETSVSKASIADGHSTLADVLEHKHDIAGAISEYKRALAIDPDFLIAVRLARLQRDDGPFAQLVDAYRERAVEPGASPYASLRLFVVRMRARPADEAAAGAELARLVPAHAPHAWVDTLVTLMQGQSTLEAALAEADAAPTDRLRKGQRCEADYYSAELRLARGQDGAAGHLLEEAAAVCPATYDEADAVDVEQRQLAAKVAAH